MPEPKKYVKDGKEYHFTVGAVIKKDGRYLLIDRNIPPPGFASVAGHVDEGESPETALIREVEEESGFKVEKYHQVFEEFVDWNWCSRGVMGHYWHVYECEVSGEIKQNIIETKSISWYLPEEIKNLKLEQVWNYWFKKLNLVD